MIHATVEPPLASDAEARAFRSTCLLVLVVTIAHLAVAWGPALGVDEAHYALYAVHLDWSYFDHPPLAGWLLAPMVALGGGELALRLPSIAGIALASLLLHRLARAALPRDPPWTATASVALFQSGLVVQVLALGMVPEVPLLVAALGAALVLLGLRPDDGPRRWLALGACLGLAGLSKYTAVTLVASAVAFALLEWGPAGLARALGRRGPWLAMALAAALILPVVLWNRSHEWISFRYQLAHGTDGASWRLERFAQTQLGQLAGYGPAWYVLGLVGLVAARRRLRERGVRLFVALALPVLVLFGWASGRERGLPHWTALGWTALAPLAAAFLARGWARRWVRALVWSSGSLSGLLFVVLHTQPVMPWLPVPDYRCPLAAVVGWREAVARAVELRDELALTPGPPPRLFVSRWSRASRVAWYARPLEVQVLDDRLDQFDLWFGAPEPGARGVLLVWFRTPEEHERDDLARFEHVRLLAEEPARHGGHLAGVFRYYAVDGLGAGAP